MLRNVAFRQDDTNVVLLPNQNPQPNAGEVGEAVRGAVLHLLPRECGRTDQSGRPDFLAVSSQLLARRLNAKC